jgi:hypothetical protein
MYGVMAAHIVNEGGNLDVDYGLVADCSQFWQCLPGEEVNHLPSTFSTGSILTDIQYSVCDPSFRPRFEEELQDMLPASLLGKALGSINVRNKVRNDPLSVLSYDVLLRIFEHVDTKDMLSLMKASYHVNSSTRDPAFWKYMMRIRILPWFYELRSFTQTAISDALDYKSLFLWIETLTRPEFGNQGPLMNIANRRRIWRACQRFVPLYKERIGPVKPAEPDDPDETKAILDSAVCLHMPMTMYPLPRDPQTISTQFIHSWAELSHRSCDFDTYWQSSDGRHFPALVGIAVTFGGQKRVFGSSEGKPGHQLHIGAGEWIRQIVVRVDDIDMFNRSQDRSEYQRAEDVRPIRNACIISMKVSWR